MRRKIYSRLLEWKNSKDRRPLMLLGARQVGKTWIMRHFGEQEYSKVVYVNCDDEPRMKQIFDLDYDIERILTTLQAITGQKATPGDTLIVLDEIQEVPRGLHSLKYFCEKAPEYHVMVAGSLLGVTLGGGESFPVGKVDMLYMYPMDYEEFLEATGHGEWVGLLRSHDWPLVDALLPKLVELLRQYYYVGGMPGVVGRYVENRDLKQVRTLQHEILDAYGRDISKHTSAAESVRIRQVLASLPMQLAKESKKFVYGAVRKGSRAKDFELAITNNIAGVSTALIILLIIGALSGAWMVSGVVPTLIYYGIQVIHPHFFLVSTCIICAVVSVMTGSSWTTIATIGIALMGIGKAQGFSEGWIAGAIISGAYFGDKVSPLSDTTILASSVTDTPLFTHIRYLMITTVPSLVITLIIFTIAGLSHEATDTGHIAEYTRILSDKFHISWWLMIVPVVTAILIARKVPSIITLFVSTALATVFALIFQPGLLCEIAGQGAEGIAALFKGGMGMLYGGTQLETGNAEINELISTRGMAGMMNTIWLIICAMCFGGAMTAGGMLGSITSVFVRFTKKRVGMVSSTVASGLFLNLATADQYISIILTGNMFKDIYSANGYESKLLSRTTEDSVTVTSPLIPWNTCGMTQATILSVPTIVYLPYAFFNIISPLMSITIAILGYKIKKKAEQPGLS